MSSEFINDKIEGISLHLLQKHSDERGFLVEAFRIDNLPDGLRPVMSYVSYTEPGFARGPHEHREQTDIFSFLGPGNFKIYLWDNRKRSPTYRHRVIVFGGEDNKIFVIVPPGVVHGYKNISKAVQGMVINYPDKLYAGWLKKEPVDEVRHEDQNDKFYEDFINS